MSISNFSNASIPNPQMNPNVNSLTAGTITAGTFITSGDLSANRLLLPSTNAALTVGVIDINSNSFVHGFDPSGSNTNLFVGAGSGANAAAMTSASIFNTGVGRSSLNSLTTGNSNACVGSASGGGVKTGSGNCYFGLSSGQSNDGSSNCSFGSSSMRNATAASGNVAVGGAALINGSTASNNTLVGNGVAQNLLTGSNNVILGVNAGSAYTGAEGSNILVGSAGVVGESNATHIGTAQTNAFISGNLRPTGSLVSKETNIATGTTITAAAIVAGISVNDNAAPAMDTGANLDAAFPSLVVGDVIKFLLVNNSGGAQNPTTGGDITFGGPLPSTAIAGSRLFYLRKTGVGTYIMY